MLKYFKCKGFYISKPIILNEWIDEKFLLYFSVFIFYYKINKYF